MSFRTHLPLRRATEFGQAAADGGRNSSHVGQVLMSNIRNRIGT